MAGLGDSKLRGEKEGYEAEEGVFYIEGYQADDVVAACAGGHGSSDAIVLGGKNKPEYLWGGGLARVHAERAVRRT
eukprot:5792953-Pyramimonas_sp.AAC.1